MTDLQDIFQVIDQLTPEELQQIRDYIEQRQQTPPPKPKKHRLNMHPGAIWTSDDFDDPLPDEFWLGEG